MGSPMIFGATFVDDEPPVPEDEPPGAPDPILPPLDPVPPEPPLELPVPDVPAPTAPSLDELPPPHAARRRTTIRTPMFSAVRISIPDDGYRRRKVYGLSVCLGMSPA